MSELTLHSGDVRVAIDPGAERLTFARKKKRLPWEIDLGKTAVVTVRRGQVESETPIRLAELTLRKLSPVHLQWVGEVSGAGVALEVELAGEDLVFTVSPLGTGDAEVIAVRWPGELRFAGDSREVCWSDYTQGALFRADGKPWTARVDFTHVACRFFAFTSGGETLAAIVDTPFDAEAVFTDDGVSRMTSTLFFKPSLGTLGYSRRVRFLPLKDSGYVAVADAFRRYAQANSLWKAFDERVDENPAVAKLKGTFVACAGYWWDEDADQVAAMKTMHKLGFTRGYLFSPKLLTFGQEWSALGARANRMTDDQLRVVQDLGYLCAPFLQVEETGPSIGEEKFAVDAKGEKIRRWEIGSDRYYEIAKWRVPAMLPVFDDRLQTCNAIHFDTLTAMPLAENWGERAYGRAGDVRLRLEIADYYRRRGKLICAESLRDWGVTRIDLATSKTFAPVTQTDPRVWTVPLTDLVYHDSTVRIHWEHHSYDDDRGVRNLTLKRYHPFGMELNDLLTASPPVLFPEGMLYYYELKPVTLPDGRRDVEVDWTRAHLYKKRITDPETQAALPKALRVCRLNERHGVARMTAHRFLDPSSPFVQESEFSTGLRVTVNFADDPFTLPDGRTALARSALVEE